MPLNKLENFIKNTEGRILYVNPNDLDATDGVENQGNSLTKPFKSVQRALIEAARFSYLRGDDNDITEKTTILLFPGEHLIDNRPGFAIKDNGGIATAVSPSGTESFAGDTLSLTLDSNFDLTQTDNILYKFNSTYGGVIVPRGTSIVGLDLRKTKIRPKYVPNPTDSEVAGSAIFRITGACYFWQFSIFDANENDLVYTDPASFSNLNQAKPTFSHHKLTCFEYADGVNLKSGYALTDLDMYYSKVSNAFNRASTREIDQKYPSAAGSFAKQRPEWEIVGAFASDPINITSIISGDGATPGSVVTVTTTIPHELTGGTPIKIRGVNVNDYNISAKVQTVINETQFTYLLPFVRDNLPAGPAGGLSGGSATVTIETDTVSGASPYVFNISLRSVWGMQGMHADGSRASGFRSMVVAQFTAVSLQKDDRAFVKYNPTSRQYDGIAITKVIGSALSSGSSSTNQSTVYHLDSDAIYRNEWKTSHIKVSNDAFIQIVSVFAIGFNKHFDVQSGGDASITNSNSNFGQHALSSDGFRKESFDKDDKGYITSIITPRAITTPESQIEWVQFDVQKTKSVAKNNHIYLLGYTNKDIAPPIISQGYRIGARVNEKIYVDTFSASVLMTNDEITVGNPTASGSDTSEKNYEVTTIDAIRSIYTIAGGHNLKNGETIRVISQSGDYPENIESNRIYYVITSEKNVGRSDGISLSSNQIQIASSKTNASAVNPIYIRCYGGTELQIVSRVSDKEAGEVGHPIQWDPVNNQWFIHTNPNSDLYNYINILSTVETDISYFLRKEDGRSLDERLYKIRYVIPKELVNAREPGDGFILQESASTNVRNASDFIRDEITNNDYDFDRNTKFITNCSYDVVTNIITVLTDRPHNLNVNDKIVIKNVTSSTNLAGTLNQGYNGSFTVTSIVNDKSFRYSSTDIFGFVHDVGTFTNNINIRSTTLPRFERLDLQSNLYVYRKEVIKPYIYNIQDGVYYIYLLNASNSIESEFTNLKYTQNIVNLYPELDKDNYSDNPSSAKSYAKRSPIGDVVTNDLRNSITRETIDKFYKTLGNGLQISSVSDSGTSATINLTREHQLSGIKEYTTLNGGSGHTDGTYYNVKLFNDASSPGSAVWDGATATVTVSGGAVTSTVITEGGSGYTNGEQLYFDSSRIGGTPQANIVINNAGISTTGDGYVQITGIGTTADGYFRITSTSNKTAISIAKTAGDSVAVSGQYVVSLGPVSIIQQTSYDSTTGIAIFTANDYHGLLAGNSFRVLDSNNNNLGDFVVNTVSNVTTFSSRTNKSLSSVRFLLKHGLSANDASADNLGENIGIRGLGVYDNETMILNQDIIVQSQFKVKLRDPSGIGITKRFPLGSYIQIDNEIMRITSASLSGSGNDEIKVIRGSMGTIIESHLNGSPIRKIKLLPVEFHRPSILRASGHTFEYLGYGPGNYSTGLPQVQVKTLSEREDFLAQAQETSCGSVIYTGMNSNGDVFSGNTKTSASSGTVVSYDIPTPTITGQDPNRASVVFDEIIVKERILIEGGNSGQILSQFDGPVTFNGDVRMNNPLILNNNFRTTGTVDFRNTTESISCTTGALVVGGGVGIGANLNVCGELTVQENALFELNVKINDNGILKFGNGDDLSIYHDGTNSYIKDSGTGNLVIQTNTLSLKNAAGTEQLSLFEENGSVTLYHDNAEKIKTVVDGVEVTGKMAASGPITGSSLVVTGSISGASLSVAGDIVAGGDITAFASDIRLKENIQPISNALNKVMTLRGFTYNFNEVGKALGYDPSISHSGVSAQEVLSVLPEAVTSAHLNNEYLSVKYDKLVPLLIEAIKDLKQEIEDLKKLK